MDDSLDDLLGTDNFDQDGVDTHAEQAPHEDTDLELSSYSSNSWTEGRPTTRAPEAAITPPLTSQ